MKPTDILPDRKNSKESLLYGIRPKCRFWLFYFLKPGGSPVQLLIDTGCTTNFLVTRVLDCLEDSDSFRVMADGT